MILKLKSIKDNQIENSKVKNIQNKIEEKMFEIESICSKHNNLSCDIKYKVEQLLSSKVFENNNEKTTESLEEQLENLFELKNEITSIPSLYFKTVYFHKTKIFLVILPLDYYAFKDNIQGEPKVLGLFFDIKLNIIKITFSFSN